MGRDKRNEARTDHFTKMVRHFMESPAWRALSPSAQALYVWVKLEWHGPKANNNGKLRLSTRQAADRMGCTAHTAGRAFLDLQAKGFIVATEIASLGVKGKGKSTAYEVTELPLPGLPGEHGRRLYLSWAEGRDFPVIKAPIGNRQRSPAKTKPRVENQHTPVSKIATFARRAS
jgi:hypothetical protein